MGCCPTKRLKLEDDFFTVHLQFIEIKTSNHLDRPSTSRQFDHCPVDRLVLNYFKNFQLDNINDLYCINSNSLKVDKFMANHEILLQ